MKKKYLYIDINNDPKVLRLIIDTIPYLHSTWSINENVLYNLDPNTVYWQALPNKTAKYFVFDFENKTFMWSFYDDSYKVNMAEFNRIRNIQSASELMDYVYEVDRYNNYYEDADGRWKLSHKVKLEEYSTLCQAPLPK